MPSLLFLLLLSLPPPSLPLSHKLQPNLTNLGEIAPEQAPFEQERENHVNKEVTEQSDTQGGGEQAAVGYEQDRTRRNVETNKDNATTISDIHNMPIFRSAQYTLLVVVAVACLLVFVTCKCIHFGAKTTPRDQDAGKEIPALRGGLDDREIQEEENSRELSARNRKAFMKTIFFFSLVIVQTSHILFFRLSQNARGKYEYNTASAITVTEALKFSISAVLYYAFPSPKPSAPDFSKIDCQMSHIQNDFTSEFVYLCAVYFLLAVFYAVNNQIVMYLLTEIGMGVLQMAKASTPVVTAAIMGSSEMSVSVVVWLILSILITSFASIMNSKLLKRPIASFHVQNMMLYSQGFIINILMYFWGINASGGYGKVERFFTGYNNWYVVLVILSQSTLGIVISGVLQYGDAIVKCLSVSTQASILLLCDILIFGYEYNAGAVCGATVVCLATYLYFSQEGIRNQKASSKKHDTAHGRSPRILSEGSE
ncbi:hypothetical protein AAMO2058_001035000 [Amorphochlora amoebiformis]